MTSTRAILVRVSGQVQGVGYRVWTRDAAATRGLSGWVRNEPDGSVTALLAGPVAEVEDMVAAMRAGPPGAPVTELSQTMPDEEAGPGFVIRR